MAEKKQKMIAINVTDELHYKIKKYALEKKTTITQLILGFFKSKIGK
jgi:hypothetical protein